MASLKQILSLPFILFTISLFTLPAFSEGLPSVEVQIPQPLDRVHQEYRISPGDLLEIDVFEVEEFKRTVRVSSRGFIYLPLLGSVEVQGLTLEGLTKRLEGLLGERYLQSPQVGISVKEAGYFYLLGKVNKGGSFPYRPGITLQQAIAMAEGFKGEEADLREIKITRTLKDGSKETFTVDYTLIMEGRLKDIPIIKEDVIFIKGLGKVYVGGYVNKPGAFDYRMDMTLQQVIASAGGISDVGKASMVQIKRVREDGGVETITVDYNRIRDGKAEDIGIREDDVIYIPRSYLLSLLRVFFFTLGVGDRHSVGVNPTSAIIGR